MAVDIPRRPDVARELRDRLDPHVIGAAMENVYMLRFQISRKQRPVSFIESRNEILRAPRQIKSGDIIGFDESLVVIDIEVKIGCAVPNGRKVQVREVKRVA